MNKMCVSMTLILCLMNLWGCAARAVPELSGTLAAVTTAFETEATMEPAAAHTTEPSTAPASEPSIAPTTKPTTAPRTEPTTEPTAEPATEPVTQPPEVDLQVYQYSDMKAMWLSQFDLEGIFRDENSQRDEASYRALMAQILDRVKDQGFNTVFLQIRPYADSMYPSAVYPMSSYVAGQTGGEVQYDPVEIAVGLAHDRGLSIHAWINPMRGMEEQEITLVGTEYAIRRWFEDPQLRGKYIVPVNGRWYLNPAYDEVVDLICAGAEEALRSYEFDGLHMDDYFYPTTEQSFDAEAYSAYQADGGSLNLADFRRENLSGLVHRLYSMTHELGGGRILGISPAGNVDTVVNSQYADVYRWCGEDGYLDYICPQVYFGLEHGGFDFEKACRTYQSMIRAENVDLIIGMTFGKALTGEDKWAGSGKDEWKNNKDVLARCLMTTRELEHCRGVAVFCYQYLFDPLTGEQVPETAREQENFIPVLREISWN